jgi:hypothetical protein
MRRLDAGAKGAESLLLLYKIAGVAVALEPAAFVIGELPCQRLQCTENKRANDDDDDRENQQFGSTQLAHVLTQTLEPEQARQAAEMPIIRSGLPTNRSRDGGAGTAR